MSARPSNLLIALLALPLPAALAAQTGQFLVRLGRDTLAVERYTRTADRLEGEQVVRSPRTVHRLYTATFGPGGVVERFELITHNVSGGPGPLERRATASFSGDTAVMTVPRGESTATMRVKTGPGALPYVGQAYALVEEVTRRARVAGTDRYTATMLPLGTDELWEVTATPQGRDSMTIVLGPLGPFRARVDGQGTVLSLSGVGSTMQVTVERVQGLDRRAREVVRASLARHLVAARFGAGERRRGHPGGALQPALDARPCGVRERGPLEPGVAHRRERGDRARDERGFDRRGYRRAGRQVQPVDHPLADRLEAHRQQEHRAVGHRLRRAIRPRPARHAGGDPAATDGAVHDRDRAEGNGRGVEAGVGEDTRVDPVLGEIALHLDFAVVADYAIVDQAGKLSVLGIFQHIWVQQFPAMHPRLHLVLRLKGKRTEIGEHQVQIRLLDEQDTEVLGGNGAVNFAEPPAGVTDIEAGAILVFDVPFPHAGAYRFEITIDGDMKASVPLTVSQLPAPPKGGSN